MAFLLFSTFFYNNNKKTCDMVYLYGFYKLYCIIVLFFRIKNTYIICMDFIVLLLLILRKRASIIVFIHYFVFVFDFKSYQI